MNRDEAIFAEAIERPAAERAAFLDTACHGEPARRARIEALLLAHEAATGFLEQSPVPRPAPEPGEQPGDKIGRYSLLRKIGDGGCGVVYLAEQSEPVRRQVALKVLKPGLDTGTIIARFEAERQALAMMDHPDIARVFDAGTTATGRPFFVMEFVDGLPITKFCDEHRMPMNDRLELFARVCVALQHAHQKGIIHRDLKPSNILVAEHSGVPAPKIIDFGIAKATQGHLGERTLVTGFEMFLGTPAYMSPEQAELRDLDIDTRSDVYSLGVLLYELLTGRPPYDPKSLVRAGVEEIRRIIREVEPPRPSTLVSTLAETDRATVARLRGAAPLQLTSVLRGDLDWIVMRCLEKDRDRRYGTAHELADDVRRHLRQEPVVACPPTALYRTQKFVARNRLACASAAAIAATLVVGTVVSVRQAVRATRAEHAARGERDAAQAAQRAESLARADAQRRQEQAEGLLTFMLGDFRTELKKIGKLDLLDAVGDKALAHFAALDPKDLTDTVLTSQAKALTQIGETRLDQARYADATTAFTAALGRAAALFARHPQNADMLFERAQAEYWLGFVARRRGDITQAREWLVRYRDSALALVALEGKTPRAQRERISGQHNLAVLELDRGNLPEAEQGFLAERAAREEMQAVAPNDLQVQDRLADVASWLGRIAELDGRFPEAIDRYREMSVRIKELAVLEPEVARWKECLAESQAMTANVLAITGHQSGAAALYSAAAATQTALAEQDPKNRQWQMTAMSFRLQQAALLLAAGDTTAATPILSDAQTKLEALFSAEPASRVFAGRLTAAWVLESRRRFMLGRDDTLAATQRAIELGEALLRNNRADTLVLAELAQAHLLAGRIASSAHQPDLARQHWNRVIDVLAPRVGNSREWRLLDPLAQAYLLLGNAETARPVIEQLQRCGYHPIDPLAVSTLGLAP